MMATTEFTARPVNINFMSLVAEVPGVHLRDLLRVHGAGHMDGYFDDEKGYGGDELGFVHNETGLELYVYSRWGVVRVGCRVDERPDAVAIARRLAAHLAG